MESKALLGVLLLLVSFWICSGMPPVLRPRNNTPRLKKGLRAVGHDWKDETTKRLLEGEFTSKVVTEEVKQHLKDGKMFMRCSFETRIIDDPSTTNVPATPKAVTTAAAGTKTLTPHKRTRKLPSKSPRPKGSPRRPPKKGPTSKAKGNGRRRAAANDKVTKRPFKVADFEDIKFDDKRLDRPASQDNVHTRCHFHFPSNRMTLWEIFRLKAAMNNFPMLDVVPPPGRKATSGQFHKVCIELKNSPSSNVCSDEALLQPNSDRMDSDNFLLVFSVLHTSNGFQSLISNGREKPDYAKLFQDVDESLVVFPGGASRFALIEKLITSAAEAMDAYPNELVSIIRPTNAYTNRTFTALMWILTIMGVSDKVYLPN